MWILRPENVSFWVKAVKREEYTLMQNQTKIVSRDEIMRVLWEDVSFVDDNTLTVNIVRLRKKLTEIGIHDRIQTKKGQGYILK